MLDRTPRILFLSLSDDVGSERIVSEMGRRGAACAVIGRPRSFAALSRFVAHHHVLPSRGGLWAAAACVARRLDAIRIAWAPDAVVPLDDMASQLLRNLARSKRTSEPTRALLRASLGDPRHYGLAASRAKLVETAGALRLRIPAQCRAADVAAARAGAAKLGYPLLLKREASCGGGGVALVRDETELLAAFRRASRKARLKRAAALLFGFRESGTEPPLSLQAFVPGRLAMRTVACINGRVLDGLSLLAEALDPPVTGSSTIVRPIDNPEMEEAAKALVAELGVSGFVSFDFLVGDDGRATLIEMNARPIGSGHLGARFGHDFFGAWLDALSGRIGVLASAMPVEAPRSIALFPKEMRRDPDSPALAPGTEVIHDVPWDEPRVIAAYRDLLVRRHPDRAGAIGRRLGAEEQRVSRGVVVSLRRGLGAR